MAPWAARHMEHLRSSLWFRPSLFVGLGIVLGLALPALDRSWPGLERALRSDSLANYIPATPSSSREVLIAMAAALATIVAVAASMTMVTVQLAASQYTPRLLRRFLSDPLTQRILGIFLCTVAYLLLVLGAVGSEAQERGQGPMPLLSLAVSMALTLVCLVLLPCFLHHAARSVEAATVISHLGREIILGVEQMDFPPDAEQEEVRAAPAEPATPLPAIETGYLQIVDERRLLSELPPGTRTVRLEARPGDFLFPGLPLLSFWPPAPLEPRRRERLHAAFAVGRERTVQQDVLYGVRQLVDMALKALSPGINDVTTAVMVVNELGAVGRQIAHKGLLGSGWAARRHGEVTLLMKGFGLVPFLEAAFGEIPNAAASQPRVIIRILEVLAQIASTQEREPLRRALVQCGQAVREASRLAPEREMDARRIQERWQELQRVSRDPELLPSPPIH